MPPACVHDAQHACADIPIISKRLGHANSQVTVVIYIHAMKNDESTSAAPWDDAIEEIIGRTEKSGAERPIIFRYPSLKKAP
jgi:hypothetical protein